MCDVTVFLKCLSCETFITSPSVTVIRKHFNKCQLTKARHNEHGDPFDMDCDDFIDDEMETVTFKLPSVVLNRCDLEHSNFKELGSEQKGQSENNNDDEDWDSGAESVPGPKVLRCPYPNCGSKFPSVPGLKLHFIGHLEKNPYVCNFPACKTKSSSVSGLRKHIKQKHLEAPPTCTKCGVTYSFGTRFKVHKCKTNINKVKSGKYKLVEIGGYWKLKSVEENVVDTKLPTDPRFISTPKLISTDPNDKTDEYINSLKRIHINAIIQSDPGFIRACKKSPGFGELLLGKEYFNGKFRPFQKRASRFFQCSKCPTMFTGRPGYIMHKSYCKGVDKKSLEQLRSTKVSPGETQLQIGCPSCGKPFQNNKILEKHLHEDHGPDEVFKCEQPDCGKFFLTAKSKEKHVFVFHKDRPYKCEKCRRCYAAKWNFDRHMENHSLNPDFGANKTPPCDLCGKTFSNVDNLRRHLKLFHGIVQATTPQCHMSKKKKTKKNKRIRTDDKTGSALELLKLPQNSEPVVVQVKIEPELTIVPDVIKSESLDFYT